MAVYLTSLNNEGNVREFFVVVKVAKASFTELDARMLGYIYVGDWVRIQHEEIIQIVRAAGTSENKYLPINGRRCMAGPSAGTAAFNKYSCHSVFIVWVAALGCS